MNLVLATQSSGSSYSMILMIVVFVGLLYFTMIRPQKKQQQKRQDMMSGLQPGDEVVTIGRLHGVVDKVDQESKTVTLDCDGIYLTFDLAAVGRVEPKKAAAAAKPAETAEKSAENADKKED